MQLEFNFNQPTLQDTAKASSATCTVLSSARRLSQNQFNPNRSLDWGLIFTFLTITLL